MKLKSSYKNHCRYLILIILVTFILILVFTVSCKLCQPCHPILILYAFDTEGGLLAEKMEIERSDTLLGRVVHVGKLSGKDIVLAESGVGMTNAAMTVQKMIDSYTPKAVLFCGIAGAIDTVVNIGDIVICDKWVTHDYGYIGAEGFAHGGIRVVPFGDDSLIKLIYFSIDSALFEKAVGLESASALLDSIGSRLPKIIVGGHGASGNSFIDQVEKRLWLSENFKALIVDMETAAVAQVCTVNGVPFIGFRSASDLAGGSGSESARNEIRQFFGVAASNSAKVVVEYLSKLE